MPEQHLFIANSNPAAGRQDDYERWSEVHVPEVVGNVEGFVAGQRYRLDDDQRPDARPSPWRFVTLYELEGEVDAIHEDNRRVRESGIYTPHEGAVADGHVGHVYTRFGEPYRAPGWTDRRGATHIMVVRANPTPGCEDDFDAWYFDHLREVVDNIDGYRGAQRYQLNASQRPGMPAAGWKQVTVYEIDSDDIVAVHRSNYDARAAGAFTPYTGILEEDHIAHIFTPVGMRVVDDEGVVAV
jgi:hypothetical protein